MIPDAWDFFTSFPGVFNGRVYFGSGDGNVYYLDAHSGALVWIEALGLKFVLAFRNECPRNFARCAIQRFERCAVGESSRDVRLR
jgi:outer membrane protein assembly factor BamB